MDLEPLKSSSRKLLVRSPVLESIGHLHIRKILQDCALHSQLVEVSVQEGDDSLRERRRTIEVHGGVVEEDFKWKVGETLVVVEFREWNACQNMRKDELKDAIE